MKLIQQVPLYRTVTVADLCSNSSGRPRSGRAYIISIFVLYLSWLSADPIVRAGSQWETPIGIPEPPFGITTTHWMYAEEGRTFDYGAGPEPYRIGSDGPYTHYIHKGHPSATDTGNPYGTPDKPRASYPVDAYVKPGSVIEIHGGVYGAWNLVKSGTAEQPVFVRGVAGDEPALNWTWFVKCSYVLLENLKWDFQENDERTAIYIGLYYNPTDLPWSHIAVRDCEFLNYRTAPTSSEQIVRIKHDSALNELVENVVVYRNHFHHCGQERSQYATGDIVGASVDQNAQNIWVLDNLFHDLGGDGVQVDVSRPDETSIRPNRVFIARNVFHDNYENAVDLKKCTNVVITQNTAYNFGPTYGGTSPPFRYGTSTPRENVWTLFNRVYDSSSTDGAFLAYSSEDYVNQPPPDYIYYIGNVIYNCHNDEGTAAGFVCWNQVNAYYLGNTVYNCDRAAAFIADRFGKIDTDQITVVNNIFGDPHPGRTVTYDFAVSGQEDALGRMTISHNLFYNSTGSVVFRRGVYPAGGISPVVSHYTIAEWQAAFPAQAVGVIEADPQHADVTSNDFRLQAGSPAIDSGTVSAVAQEAFDRFERSFGIDIRKDIDGRARTGVWDIGAYEYAASDAVYTLAVTATHGTVTVTPDKNTYTEGESVVLLASPESGYGFVEWSGDLSGSGNPSTVVMNSSKTVVASFAANTHTLTIVADNGAVTKSPDKAGYEPGETVTLTAAADAGFTFAGWSGDASGANGSVTITMDADKAVTAVFASSSYTLTVAASNGSVVAVPQKAGYSYGETVSLQAVASAGYHFSSWSGDLSGSVNPSSIVMNASKSVTAGFAINTYTLDVSAANGSVAASPTKAVYGYGETVGLAATAASGYEFAGWSGDLTGSSNPVTVVMNSNKSIAAAFSVVVLDQDPPVPYGYSPLADAIQAPLNSLVLLRITDSGDGVDGGTVSIRVDGNPVYAGDVAGYSSRFGTCRRIGTPAHYVYAYQPAEEFDFDAPVTVTVNAADLAGNAMAEYSYSFRTQMRSFGSNRCASWGGEGLDKGAAATACDASGNIWAVWHAGATGARDIYLARLAPDSEQFGGATRLTANAGDQCNPDIAIGADGRLYIVWQDNRRGNWDIFASTSADGVSWSSEAQVSDSDRDEIDPAIAVDARSPNCAYVAWQDNRSGNQDIYVAGSSNGFVSKTVACVASGVQDQIGPRIAVDGANTVYLLWTDYRNGPADVYGAASDSGPWTNVPVATGAGNQSAPAIAAAGRGSALHFAWVTDAAGDDDVLYGTSLGLPASPLTGTNIIDDSSHQDQRTPDIVVADVAGGSTRVFVSWQDFRNAADGLDTDLYMVEIRAGGETNLFVGDGGTRTNQSEPAVGVDLGGSPYVLWTDSRNTTEEIYFAAATFVEPTALDSGAIVAATGGTVGAASPSGIDEVSVVIPPGACPYDVTVRISKIQNLQPNLTADILPYEFSPSGLQFDAPVTITIPYAVAEYGADVPQPYWYDAATGMMTQQGVTNIEYVALSSTIHALRFQTTHFTPYALLAGADAGSGASGGSGGGGCSLSGARGESVVGYFLPYAAVALFAVFLRRRDRRHREKAGDVQTDPLR